MQWHGNRFGKFIFILIFSALCSGCLSRAPTKYELDKRGVTEPSGGEESGVDDNLRSLTTNSHIARKTHTPQRLPPLIEKAWVEPKMFEDGTKAEGYWIWFEVDQGHWMDEEETGAAPLVFDENQSLRITK
jgi:hypothetical protein